MCLFYSTRLEVEGETRRSASRMCRRSSEPTQVRPSEQPCTEVEMTDDPKGEKDQDCTLNDQDILDAVAG